MKDRRKGYNFRKKEKQRIKKLLQMEGVEIIPIVSKKLKSNAFCFTCNTKLDGVTGIGFNSPKEGNLSICGYCKQIAQFDKNLNLTPVSDVKLREMILYDPSLKEKIDLYKESIDHKEK